MKYAIAVFKKEKYGNTMFALEITEEEFKSFDERFLSLSIKERKKIMDMFEDTFN